MALGTLPYKAQLTATSTDANGAPTVTLQVQDATGTNKGSAIVLPLGGLGDVEGFRRTINAAVTAQAVADAGSVSAFLTGAVTAANQNKEWFLGSPGFIPITIPVNGLSIVTWAAMPLALTALAGGQAQVDLSLVTQARLSVHVVVQGAAAAVVGLQFSTDNGANWAFLDAGTGPNVSIAATGLVASAWVSLTATAKADVRLRFGGQGGNGVASPQFGLCILQVR